MDGAVEELLRYTSPTQYMARTTTRPVDAARRRDARRRQGACSCSASGNRDPREFDRPDEFDITRTNPRILAFGHGAHVCLGAAVARLEARIALQEFLARYPRYDGRRGRGRVPPLGQRAGPDARPGVGSCADRAGAARSQVQELLDRAGDPRRRAALLPGHRPPRPRAGARLLPRRRHRRARHVHRDARRVRRLGGWRARRASRARCTSWPTSSSRCDGDDAHAARRTASRTTGAIRPTTTAATSPPGFRYVDRFARRDGDWRIAAPGRGARVDARRPRRAAARRSHPSATAAAGDATATTRSTTRRSTS